MRPLICPSILAADFANLHRECAEILACGGDELHLDVMDGHFVPNITFGAPIAKCLRASLPSAVFDCHLMVTHPHQWIPDFQDVRADRITFHLEAVENCDAAISLAKEINSYGIKSGLSIKPKTPLSGALNALDSGYFETLLIMTVEPGFGGQSFMHEMMPKVSEARKRYGSKLTIQVDGGINVQTAKIAAANGANSFVAGTSVFAKADRSKAVQALREAVEYCEN